jgi:hypothetical protein
VFTAVLVARNVEGRQLLGAQDGAVFCRIDFRAA